MPVKYLALYLNVNFHSHEIIVWDQGCQAFWWKPGEHFNNGWWIKLWECVGEVQLYLKKDFIIILSFGGQFS